MPAVWARPCRPATLPTTSSWHSYLVIVVIAPQRMRDLFLAVRARVALVGLEPCQRFGHDRVGRPLCRLLQAGIVILLSLLSLLRECATCFLLCVRALRS